MSAALVATLSMLVVTVGLFAVTLPVGLLATDAIPPAPFGMGTLPSPEHHYQFHACGCNNSWAFATNERAISNEFFAQTQVVPDPRSLSALAAFMGQFFDHEVVLSEFDPSFGFFTIAMEPYNGTAPLNLTRSKVRIEEGTQCRSSINTASTEIDASNVYGSYFNPELSTYLRDNQGTSCKLRTSPGNLMPLSPTHPNQFESGDPTRSTEHSILASLHTLWMREHNRLCDDILQRRPNWNQEQAFWKARQVVIAKMQHICYSEWLPAILGSQVGLLNTAVPQSLDTRMSMEFSVAAFRFGHSLIPDPIGPFALPSIFFNASMLVEYNIDAFLEAAYQTEAQAADSMVVDGLRNFLFAAGPMQIGEDLITRNLFRSRELGMSNYSTITQCYHIQPQDVGGVEEFYVGMLEEPIVSGSSLPRAVATVVAEQFKRIRLYDPNFYTKKSTEIGSYFFSEVMQTTMASLLRANTNLQNVPDEVFFVV